MPPRGTVTWRRPHTAIYNDNYRFGTGLYSDTLSGCQKKRSDRPESSLSTYSLAKTPVAEECHHASLPPLSPVAEVPFYKGSVFENLMNSALYSSYAKDLGEDMDVQTAKKKTTITTTTATATSNLERQTSNNPVEIPRPQSLYDDANLFLTSPKFMPFKSASLVEGDTKKKRKKVTESSSSVQIATAAAPTATITTTATTVNSPPQNGPNTGYWKEQCRDLQSQVDVLTQALGDMNDKLKGELSTMKGRLHSEITDLTITLDQSSLQSNELQKTVKKQANQLLDLQSAYDDLQRHLQDSLDEVAGHQRRSQTLRKEMDRLRAEVEGTLQKA